MSWTFPDKRPNTEVELYDPTKITAVQIGGNVIRVKEGTYEEDTFQVGGQPTPELFRFVDMDSPALKPEWVIGETKSIQAMWCHQ